MFTTHSGLTLKSKEEGGELIDHVRRFNDCASLLELPEFEHVFTRSVLKRPQLPPHLKKPYAYCSLFSLDYRFQKDHLIQIWKAEGFVESDQSGSQCFDDMLSRSILQPLNSNNNDKQPAVYIMQGFNHNFARILASKAFRRIDTGTKKTFSGDSTIRHLSLTCEEADDPLLEQIKECKKLRTFLLLHRHVPRKRNISYSTFLELKFLRLLVLSHTEISKLKSTPLNHLRYLDLSDSNIKNLPDPIHKYFRALQVLKLENCSNLEKLPTDLTKLFRLTHLHVNMHLLSSLPTDLGSLTKLECLSSYIVGKEEGYKLEELRWMENLREIFIFRLENVTSGEEAMKTNLREKKWLSKVVLQWDTPTANSAADVLEGLEPENGLKDLTVTNYPCQKFPAWLTSLSRKLVTVCLRNCDGCKSLPPLGQLPLLKTLVLHSLDNLETVNRGIVGRTETAGFPRLESLELRDMQKLLYWIGMDAGDMDMDAGDKPGRNKGDKPGRYKRDMPCLRNLKIIECPRLVYLCPLNQKAGLINLQIKTCPKLKSLPRLSPSLEFELGEVIIEDSPFVKEKFSNHP